MSFPSRRAVRELTADMNKHNPKRFALIVLLAGGALAGVALKHRANVAQRAQDAPVLADIPAELHGSPEEGELVRAYSVMGMCCESCTRKLHGRIVSMKGVEACAVDLVNEHLSMIVKKDVPAARILSVLNFEKYTAVELP